MTHVSKLDLTDPEFVADPYPGLAELRATAPILWHEPSRKWLATTHSSVSAVLRNRAFGRIWQDKQPAELMEPFNTLHRNQMMENEPPDHTRLRRLVSKAFARGHVERMRPRIDELVTHMLDGLTEPVHDILGDFAEPLPVYVIADLLGVPRSDHADLRAWSQAIVHMYEEGVDEDTYREAAEASSAFSQYIAELLAYRRSNPGEDLITDLLAERDEGTRLNEDELIASVAVLLNAGHEASVNVFGNGLNALLEHPDQLGRITSGDVPADIALEELIRYDAPLQLFERTATEDVEVCDHTIAAGEKVACLMGSANRDAGVFGSDADRFDVARDPNPHVGFGMGVHFCLGAPLARVELQTTFGRLLEAYPLLERVGESPRRPTWVLRGFERIDVRLDGGTHSE